METSDLDKMAWPYKYGLVATALAAVLLIVLIVGSFYHTSTVRSLRADVFRLSSIDTASYNHTIRTLDKLLQEKQAAYDSLDATRPPFQSTPTANLNDAELQALLKRRLRGE